uniref:protein Shroom3 n=1 Tax=Myodes glareolus TaxID=447135 RepID=UPI00201FCB19|nr:protein Shroom3 [Myodes glareolus]
MMRTPENLEEPSSTPNPGRTPKERFVYLEALLEGGAPWGFTLKGGLEHGEPLIISKIEEGGKADVVNSGLQAGDEVVHINEVALSSSRREAVSLVKGSYKTLRLVVRRDVCADSGHAEPGVSNSLSSELLTGGPQHRKATWSGGVKLRLKQRCSETAARPHSWHTTKFGENQPDASMMQISQGTMGPPWHQSYHSSSSTSDLSNYDHAYLRRSPDRCSSQGSMESLEPSGGYPACHLLSPAKSTSSIDQLGHLHNKRDSAYSSFSTSSSILEYPPPGGSGQERSGSMDTISARGGLLEGMRQADIRYVKTVYDSRRGVSSEYEVSPSALLLQGRNAHASAGLQGCAKWHSVPRGKGAPSPSWSQQYSDTATDSLAQKVGAPMPPTRSDSYAAFRQRERPSSWSSLDQKRFCRPQTNSAGSVKTPLMEEQLHTVVEGSPESSPPVKPKHSYTQKAQPGQPLLPTGIYPVPSPEPHFAQVPQPSVSSNGTVYPALVKESGYTGAQGPCNKMATLDENGNQNEASRPGFAFCQPLEHDLVTPVERNPEPTAKHVSYKVHFSSVPENEDSSLKKQGTPLQDTSPSYPSERKNAPGSRPCSNHHGLSSPQALALHVGRPPQTWEGDLQEDHNANLRQKLEKEGQGQSQPGNFGKTKSAFSSLQNIPESLRRQSNVELGGEAQEGHSGGRPTCALTSSVEEPGRKAGPDSRSYQDRPVSYSRPEGKMNTADSFQGADPRYEEPPAPALQQTPGLSQRRLSSSSASALQYRKPHCSVLEKVSKIEEREQGRHRLPSVGSPTYGLNYRPHRAGPASSTSAGDFEDPKASIHFSEATEPLGNGEPPLKNGESRFEEASWQPCGQPLRRAGDGRGPPARGGEPPRPDARLLRSQSTFQLFSDTEREAPWPEDRPGTPESPPLDAPFTCSLSSLREPDVPLSRQEHPHLATDTLHAPRDRSSSFASGRLGGERRRWDPQPPRQPLSGANCGPRATQRPDRTPGGGPPSWSMVAANTGKSKSAEDLLERSDTLAVPVHVRSRSSPTSNKKGQDVLLREDSGFGFVKDPCCVAGPGSRSASCSDRGQKEPTLPLHRPTPCWDDSGCKSTVGSSAPTECSGTPDHPKQLRTPCSRPLSAGMQGHFLDTRAASIAPPSTPLPSPVPSSYRSQLTIDQQTERSGQPGRQPLPPSAPALTHRNDGRSLTQPPSPKCHELSSPEHGLEEGMWKRASLPQRPAPPWTKWAHAVREDSFSEDTSVPEFADLKHYKNQSLPSSCSTMDPDTPGRISLRISESALQASPPPRGDYEDEVFVKDLHPRAASSPTLEALPPPPPLPPPLSQETLVNSSDDFPPPPPQAVYEAVLDSEMYKEAGSSSCQFPMVTVSRDRHEPGAVHSEGCHIMTPKPPQTPAAGSEAESNTPADAHAQPQLTGSLGEQASPSQTQSLIHETVGRTQDIGKKIHAEPQKTSEDIRTEALAKEIVHQDKSLADILDPDSRMKTTMDLMEGLFPGDAGVLRESGTKRRALETAGRQTGCEAKRSDDRKAVGMLVSCPAYYSVSAAKAELLNKIKDMPEAEPEEEEQEDVNEKKAELIGSLTHKLEILQEAKGSLLMDIKLNNALGEEVEALISELCKPNEFDKYKMFIGDLDKVVNLLLSLSGRLARVENVLSGLGEDASKEERSSLNEKRKILAGQHEDARELKENLDRRERVVLAILANYLSAEQLQDYQHFVKMKSTLLIEQRKLDDKIKLGQEQVKCLLESLPSDFRPKAGAISLPPALSSHVTPAGGSVGSSVLRGGFPTLTSPL